MSSPLPAGTYGKAWLPLTPEDLAPELPAYEILGFLGRGGMGAVYKARQKSLNREVAIKVLPRMVEDGGGAMHFADRFKREAEGMANLNHPSIVAVYDAGETPSGLLFFVMELVQGTDVGRMIQSNGRLPPEHAYAIAAHVCEALAYAHGNGLIHRDIKPANIMVDMHGRVKVADFGLAKAVDAQTGFTQSNMAVGTPDFVAPEALITGMPVDARVDLYAVGVMLYQMLTGHIPRGAWQPASVIAPGTDPRFDEIIMKAMAYDREQRHHSASELRQHLDSLLMPAVTAPDLQRYSSALMTKTSAAAARSMVSASRQPPAPRTKPTVESFAAPVQAERSNKSLFIGLGVAVATVIAAFLVFAGGEKVRTSRFPIESSERGTSSSSASQTQANPSAITTPLKVSSPDVGSVVRVKESEAQKSEPPMPAATASKEAEPKTAMALESHVKAPAEPTPQPAKTQPLSASPATVAAVANSLTPTPHLPPELAELDKRFIDSQNTKANAPFEEGLANLNDNYIRGIRLRIDLEKKKGRLDEILALEDEQKRISENQQVPESDDEKNPVILKELRAAYRVELAKLIDARAKELKRLAGVMDELLKKLETDFTVGDRLADAKLVRAYRDALQETSAGLLPPLRIAASRAGESSKGSGSGPKLSATLTPTSMLALKDGITNTLGMKFLPVKGTDVLFCVHETRHQDYGAYAAAVPGLDVAWKGQLREGIPCGHKDDHPVVGVSWNEAMKFCAWLSEKEGRNYRLPTDEEWSIAVGLGHKEKHDKDVTPELLHQNEKKEFPWDDDYPPRTKDKAGNYADTVWKEKFPNEPSFLKDYTEGFPTTAPVMSFKANKFGLYDMGGNVWEWVEDCWNATNSERVLRGASYSQAERGAMLSSARGHSQPSVRYSDCGFRVVLVVR
jgi:serine/threonine protein kinase